VTSGNRVRIAIHSDLRERGDQAAIYRKTLELFTRATAYLRVLGTLASILDGDQINGTDQELNPPAPGLSARIWGIRTYRTDRA
jgi:hypothetical protein